MKIFNEKSYKLKINLYTFLNNSELDEEEKNLIDYKKTNEFIIDVFEYDTISCIKKKILYVIDLSILL